jgi:hypothetical protein
VKVVGSIPIVSTMKTYTAQEKAEMQRMMIDPTCFGEPEVPGWDKIEEVKEVVQEKKIAVNPINPNFVFLEYDSRDAKSLHNFMVSASEYQQEQEKLRKARCCCGSCKCGR